VTFNDFFENQLQSIIHRISTNEHVLYDCLTQNLLWQLRQRAPSFVLILSVGFIMPILINCSTCRHFHLFFFLYLIFIFNKKLLVLAKYGLFESNNMWSYGTNIQSSISTFSTWIWCWYCFFWRINWLSSFTMCTSRKWYLIIIFINYYYCYFFFI